MDNKLSPEDQIYIPGLTLLKLIGEYMQYTSGRLLIFRTVNCIVFSTLTVLNFTNYFHIDANIYTKNAEASVVIFHVLLKYIVFIYYKPIIEEILFSRHKFWKPQNFKADISFACNTLFRRIKSAQIAVVIWAYATLLLFVSRPYFGSIPLFEMWTIRDTIGFNTVVLMLQYYLSSMTVSVVVGYDLLYASFCFEIVVQIRLLKVKLKELTVMNHCDSRNELRNCINHHGLLLFVFKQMRNIYSVMLLFHYFITLSASCVELYELILGHSDLSRKLSVFMNMSMLITQFAYYSFPAEFVASEFADISKAIYMSKWYNCEVAIQKKLYFMMTKSQHTTYFSAAGIININIETFGGLVKKIVSFCAVLRNLLNP